MTEKKEKKPVDAVKKKVPPKPYTPQYGVIVLCDSESHQEAGKPMKVQEIMEAALAKGYCKVGGKTPFNSFNGGIRSEITKKGKESRFKRVDKGLFAAR